MPERCTTVRDVAALAVARAGRVEETGDPLLPFRLLDEQGTEVLAITEFLHRMLADDASPASLRSYAYELLAWFRFLDAVMVPLGRALPGEAVDCLGDGLEAVVAGSGRGQTVSTSRARCR